MAIEHAAEELACEVERRQVGHRHRGGRFLCGRLENGSPAACARAVHQDIGNGSILEDRSRNVRDGEPIGEISWVDLGPSTVLAYALSDRLQADAVACDQAHLRASGGQ